MSHPRSRGRYEQVSSRPSLWRQAMDGLSIKSYVMETINIFKVIGILIMLTGYQMLFALIWGLLFMQYPEILPEQLAENLGTLAESMSFFITFGVGFHMNDMLKRHSTGIDQFNALVGQCSSNYDCSQELRRLAP